MIDISVKDAIQKLKEKVFGQDYDASARQHVLDWEKQLEVLGREADFQNLAVTRELIKGIKEKLHGLIRSKLTTSKLSIREVDALEVKIQENTYFLKLLTPNIEAEIEQIYKMILDEI